MPLSINRLLMRETHAFLLALGFLSRLGPSMAADKEDMGRAVAYYPYTGCILGGLAVLPVLCGFFASSVWVQAWCYSLLGIWLTRGLHLDGLADLCDALGSGKSGEGFRAVLKDSRIGAFGAIALIAAITGQLLLAAALLERGTVAPLFFAPIFGRALPLFLALSARPYSGEGLGALVAAAPKKRSLCFCLALLVPAAVFCLNGTSHLPALVFGALLLAFLARVARRHGGYNGDFFGFAIVTGELALLAAALL